MTDISASIIARSLNPATGDILTTALLRYPRWIHSELMTHRVFSRNAASSRAIPVKKLISEAAINPAEPIVWTQDEPGMQGRTELSGDLRREAEEYWDKARLSAIKYATHLATTGAHKQLVNRLLEPYIHITTLVSATEWTNFFELRDHPDAEPHLRMLARELREQMELVKPLPLLEGAWHTPFVTPIDIFNPTPDELAISVARCAATSYQTVDMKPMTPDRAWNIIKKLTSSPLHASPFEHLAQPDVLFQGGYLRPTSHRNFRGFIQLRARIELGEITL